MLIKPGSGTLTRLRLMGTDGMSYPGRYRHDKGNDCTVIGIAKHSETDEEANPAR